MQSATMRINASNIQLADKLSRGELPLVEYRDPI